MYSTTDYALPFASIWITSSSRNIPRPRYRNTLHAAVLALFAIPQNGCSALPHLQTRTERCTARTSKNPCRFRWIWLRTIFLELECIRTMDGSEIRRPAELTVAPVGESWDSGLENRALLPSSLVALSSCCGCLRQIASGQLAIQQRLLSIRALPNSLLNELRK